MDATESKGVSYDTFYPAASAYIVISLLWLAPLAFFVLVLFKKPGDRSAWEMAAMIVAYGMVLTLWLMRFRLQLRGDTVLYRSLFRGQVTIPLGQVESAHFVMGGRRLVDRFSAAVRLEIVMKTTTTRSVVSINTKVFRSEDVRYLLKFLPHE